MITWELKNINQVYYFAYHYRKVYSSQVGPQLFIDFHT